MKCLFLSVLFVLIMGTAAYAADIGISNVCAQGGDIVCSGAAAVTDGRITAAVFANDGADIVYINQFEDAVNNGVYDLTLSFLNELPDGDYLLRVGGTGIEKCAEMAFAKGAAQSVFVWGDADGNGAVTAADAAIVLQYVLNNSYPLTGDCLRASAVCGVYPITAKDSAAILQKVLNYSFVFDVEKQTGGE